MSHPAEKTCIIFLCEHAIKHFHHLSESVFTRSECGFSSIILPLTRRKSESILTIYSDLRFIFIVIFLYCNVLFYLPAEIAAQWNENGISSTASKFIVLIFPALNLVFIILHNQKSRVDISKSDFISLFTTLVLFAAQSIITLNALGQIDMLSLNYGLLQTVALLVVGLMIYGQRRNDLQGKYGLYRGLLL